MKVSIRPLKVSDALISYRWRNDASVWRYTGSKPTHSIDVNKEIRWIQDVLQRPNEKRFAICIDKGYYVGNVQLTNISNGDAEFHIFIGNINFHGRGIGTQATMLILAFAKDEMGLERVHLYVHPENLSAISVYEKCGFRPESASKNSVLYVKRL